ncbi:LysM peptidoglycan-binding domain-containing protein, partial [Staphylococcus hominis]|uniref:LysM peptidoglycan-binding domain-containing protein n=1 Tax=Staphylococcus hominis TaxID=1290 RepID=UPI001F548001
PGQVIEIGGSGSQGQESSSNATSGGSTHTVESGESLNIIANKYGVSVEEIVSANTLNGYIIYPNQTRTTRCATGTGGAAGSATERQNKNTGDTSASDSNQ